MRNDPGDRSMRSKLHDWDVADIERLAALLHALNEDAVVPEAAAEKPL